MGKAISRERIERAARMYKTNIDASKALGIIPSSFGKLCRQWNIETPWARKRAPREA